MEEEEENPKYNKMNKVYAFQIKNLNILKGEGEE